ncbi:retrovirus-related pol polyprotein from transposon TNT 1-94 [Tanacetum coccineum]
MTTLAEKAILSGADNHPPMLENDMYDSWKIRMEIYMLNRQHGRMILESVKNAIQADCDIKATNIILQGLPPEVYALVSNHKVAKELWARIQLLMQGTSLTEQERECKLYDEFDKFAYKKGETLLNQQPEFSQPDSGLIVPVFQKGDDPIDAIDHMMSFLTVVVTSRYPTTNNQLRNSSNPRYKEQIKVLKEGQNVDLRSNDNISDSSAQSVEIDHLKQTLSEHLKEKESLMQTKAQQLEPKLYDGNVIKNTSAIVIPDSEETLMLAEESRSKMLLKQKDPMMLEKKVNTTPVDYAVLNQLSQDFVTRFIPQTELSAEQAFWSKNSVNSSDPNPSCRPTKVEVPNELPKVDMVNTSLKKLKHHLAGFDVVVKERTTTIAIFEGSWGFEHIKACFRDEIITFVKALKDLFDTFDQYLIDELFEVQNVFHQMEQATEQDRVKPVIWRPTLDGKTLHYRENACPLTRNTTTTEEPLEGVDLLTGSRGNNLYTLSLGDMMASSPICLLSKATKTKSWLWHRRLSHLNFGAINHLARHGLVRASLQTRTHEMTLSTTVQELVPNPPPSTPVDRPAPEVIAPIHEVVAPVPDVSTGSPSLTNVDQDAPSLSNSQTTPETQPPDIPNDVEEDNHDMKFLSHMGK